MKKLTVIAIVFLWFTASAQQMPGMKMPSGQKENKKQTQQEIYTCVMHPEVKMDKPGKCPKCGMTLVKKTIKNATPKSVPKKQAVPKKVKDVMPHKAEMKNEPETDRPMEHGMNMDSLKTDPGSQIGDRVIVGGGKTVRYDLYVADTIVNFTGKQRRGIALNGSIPAPTLTFTEGDTAEVYLHNTLKTATSLHWHGVILPNEQDGVPMLTTSMIPGGTTHVYKFPIVQNGTYWYHSHSGFQQQVGTYGALVFKSRENNAMTGKKIAEIPLVLSDWTDENPEQVQRRLRAANDWYAIKKGSVQGYAEAIKKGYFTTKLANEWKRMNAMDVSDVYYEKFLSNGKPEIEAPQFKAGDKVRLRVVNGGSSSYFWLQYAGGKITVVANDGNDVVPVEVDRLIIGVAETYDVIVTIPKNMSYEFRSTPEDRSGYTSLWLGSGMKMPAPTLPTLKYFEGMKMMNGMMKMNGDMKPMEGMQMSLQSMDMNTVMYPEITGSERTQRPSDVKEMPGMKMDNMKDMDMTSQSNDIATLNYAMLRSPVKTTLPDIPTRTLNFTLEGNMNRYVWSINNKTVGEWDKVLIKQGEKVRIILTNNSMMRHPMHLHGHDFRVLGEQGEYALFKNTLDIMPMETDTLELAANKSGDWFFHCHILYHMMAGMGNVLSYQNSPPNPQIPDKEKAFKQFKRHETMIHPVASIGLESNGSDATFLLAGNRFEVQGLWHLGLKPEDGREAELNFGRYIGKMQWLFPYVGFDYHYKKGVYEIEKNSFGQISNKNNRKTFVAGVQYTLPMLVVADGRVDGDGKFRFQLSREDIPLSNRIRLNMMWNTDKEYAAGLKYVLTNSYALSTHYDSDMGYGAGISLNY
jgi:CopA family copper-resistance protein